MDIVGCIIEQKTRPPSRTIQAFVVKIKGGYFRGDDLTVKELDVQKSQKSMLAQIRPVNI